MEEQTTTEPSSQEAVGEIHGVAVDSENRAISQPEEAEETAGSQTEEPVSTEQEDTGEVDTTDELAKWAANKGIEVSTESERKLAEMARNSEKAMHTKTSEASELQKSVEKQTGTNEFGDPLTELQERVQRMELEANVRNFYQDHPDARNMDAELGKLVEQRPHLAGDLEALYALAKVNSLSKESDNLRREGGKQALEDLAGRQQASAPSANAKSTTSGGRITAENVDALIARNGHDWYMKNRDTINAVLEG